MPGAVFWERFKEPGQYLQARRAVEAWLRCDFVAKGGVPQQPYPIYMVLGMTKWLAAAADDVTLATTADIRVPLSLFAECDVSFTYPDSMASFMLAQQPDAAYYLADYHGKGVHAERNPRDRRIQRVARGALGHRSSQLPRELYRGAGVEPRTAVDIPEAGAPVDSPVGLGGRLSVQRVRNLIQHLRPPVLALLLFLDQELLDVRSLDDRKGVRCTVVNWTSLLVKMIAPLTGMSVSGSRCFSVLLSLPISSTSSWDGLPSGCSPPKNSRKRRLKSHFWCQRFWPRYVTPRPASCRAERTRPNGVSSTCGTGRI